MPTELDILFFISIAVIFGFVGGRIVHLVRLPGVVGYLVAGLILGPSFLDVFNAPLLDRMGIFTSFALSLVAFKIGGDMNLSTLKEIGKGIGVITITESLGAFLLVAAGVYLLTGKLYLAMVFGAMAPASAPAGTVAVLQECKAKGHLTNALYAVVGLDDGLAIMIFAVAIALGKLFLTGGTISAGTIVQGPVLDIVGSIILGSVVGVITGYFAQRVSGSENILAISLSGILICASIANYLHFSLILANLSLGMIFVNLFSVSNRNANKALTSISLPIYIIFFFLAGAGLRIRLLPNMGILGLIYVVCRIAGLMGGAYFGARISKASPIIRRYLGLGILSQAGVAIGLAVLAAEEFDRLGPIGQHVGVIVVNIIAASTIFFEIIGPVGAKIAIAKAGEAGVNITEEDLVEKYTVEDVMDTHVPAIPAGLPLSEVIRVVSDTDSFYYSVVDEEQKLIGAITLDGIRKTFTSQELNDWLVALDVMEPIRITVTPDMGLQAALDTMKRAGTEHIPVVSSPKDMKLLGILDLRAVYRQLSAEVLAKQQEAESIYNAG